jgi:hypothetical protein
VVVREKEKEEEGEEEEKDEEKLLCFFKSFKVFK